MTENKIKNELRSLAEDFNLKFNEKWFNFVWISKKQEILAEFLSNCQDPIYKKYGKNLHDRIDNFDQFIQSKDFCEGCKRFGGSVYSKEDLGKYKKIIKKIKNPIIKKEIKKFIIITEKKLKNLEYIPILTKTKIKNEEQWLFKYILRHEWIHLLLNKNKITFSDWRYNEGLNEYLGSFAGRNLKDLEVFRDKEKYPYQKQYFIFAIKFRNWMRNINSSKDRKMKLMELVKKYGRT
jgi:hypothetical protein